MRHYFLLLLFCSVGLAWNTGAFAQYACAEEQREFCGNVLPGGGRIAKCLSEHFDELGLECKRHARKVVEKVLQVHFDCVEDVEKFCPDIEPGQGRIGICLNAHRDSLSMTCRRHVDVIRQTIRGLQVCGDDAKRLCSGVVPGEGRIMACLWNQRYDLDKKCRTFVKRQINDIEMQ